MATDPLRRAGEPPAEWAAGARVAGFFEAHGRMVYGLCRALLRDPADAEDASQATFVSAYRALLAGGDVREPAAWLATIARNECRGRARARMREPLALQESDLAHGHGPEEELERRHAAEEIRDAIADLPDKQREAVVLRDLYGMRYDEVGSALGVSRASVESLLFRARRQLRVRLKPIAGGAIVLPLALREGIAQALPGFAAAGSGGGMLAAGAAAGATGGGVLAGLASFTSAPIVAKVAVAAVAIGAAGSTTLAGSDRVAQADVPRPSARVAAVAMADPAKVLALAAPMRSQTAGSTGAHASAGEAAASGNGRERVGSEDGGPGREQGGERPARAESSGPTGSESADGESGHGAREQRARTQEPARAESHGLSQAGSGDEAGTPGVVAKATERPERSQEASATQAVAPTGGPAAEPVEADKGPPAAAEPAVSSAPADEPKAPDSPELRGSPEPAAHD